jgi:phosphate transport system substrate-binding protein
LQSPEIPTIKEKTVRRTLAILAGAAVAASTVALAAPAQAANTISGGGASFPFPFIQACASDFNASQNNFDIQYTSTGSGTGKSNFQKGVFVYGQTDSKYSSGEPSFDWEYIPNIGGAIAFPINLKNSATGRSLGSSIQLKQTTLAKLLSGNLKTWRAPEILKDNPRIAKAIPNVRVTVAYRSGNSGTSNNTLQYLNAWAPTIWSKVQDDFSTAFPGGKPPANSVSGKDNAAVLSLVASKPGTIGYVDLGDAKGYPSARVQNALGEFVAPSSSSAAKNLANQTNVAPNGLVSLNYKLRAKGAYPVAIFSYMLARTDGKGPNGLGVRQFASYVLQKCGPARAASLGYVPVGGKVLAKSVALMNKIK